MSDQKKTGGLRDIMDKVKAGAAGLATPKRKQGSENDTEPTIEPTNIPAADQRPVIDDFSDPLLIDPQDQSEPEKPAKKQMSTSKKVVLAAVVVCVGVMAKNGYFTPATQHHTPAQEIGASKVTQPPTEFPNDSKGQDKGLDAGLPSLGEPAENDPAVGKTLDQLQLDGPLQKPLESHEQGPVSAPQTQLPVDSFGFPATPSVDTPPQLNVTVPAPSPEHVAGAAPSPFEATATSQQGAPIDTAAVFGSIPASTPTALPAAPTIHEKGDPVLGSASIQNPDSSAKPSQVSSTADVKKMEAQLVQKDQQIKSLKEQLASKQARKASPAPARHAVATAPKHSPAVAHRSTPRAITPVAKIAPRPKLCVKAVAPPARNCATCVAHAFVVDAGAENMVGQGDFLDGYRVSITGDRLDLQNSDGQVVHKFWSQINGCPTI